MDAPACPFGSLLAGINAKTRIRSTAASAAPIHHSVLTFHLLTTIRAPFSVIKLPTAANVLKIPVAVPAAAIPPKCDGAGS